MSSTQCSRGLTTFGPCAPTRLGGTGLGEAIVPLDRASGHSAAAAVLLHSPRSDATYAGNRGPRRVIHNVVHSLCKLGGEVSLYPHVKVEACGQPVDYSTMRR